jgi:hypothetical protein
MKKVLLWVMIFISIPFYLLGLLFLILGLFLTITLHKLGHQNIIDSIADILKASIDVVYYREYPWVKK